MRHSKLLLAFLTILFLTSCSNPKKDYESVQQLQNTSEQNIRVTSEDAVKLKYCDNVINALNDFIKKNPDGNWNITAKTALQNWQSKRALIQENINSKLDFDKTQKLQLAAEEIMQHSTDYMVRLNNCNDIIKSLNLYISNHPEGEWTQTIKNSLKSWESRKTDLNTELASLSSILYSKLRYRAIEEAEKVHNFSNIEKIELNNRDTQTLGSFIQVTDVYNVRMVAKIFRSNIYKLKITVLGEIDPATKQVEVKSARVEE